MTKGNEGRQYLSTTQVAEKFSVSARTVRRWAELKSIPFIRTPGGELRFPAHLLDEWARDAERVAEEWFSEKCPSEVGETVDRVREGKPLLVPGWSEPR